MMLYRLLIIYCFEFLVPIFIFLIKKILKSSTLFNKTKTAYKIVLENRGPISINSISLSILSIIIQDKGDL